ncbi:MAG: serine hydrolase [Virgibacillus proomii]
MVFIIITIVGIILFAGIGMWLFKMKIIRAGPKYIIQFITENTQNKRAALSIHYNGTKWADINADELLPLASTVKIIVAIEYARQAAEGKIDPNQLVLLEELDTFYIPNTDGGAHEAWINGLDNGKLTTSVPLSEVAKGMIAYSSNANTDYLIRVLGLMEINNLLKSLEIDHEPLYPIVSALFIPLQLMNEENLSKREVYHVLKHMSMDEYRKRAIDIHHKWIKNPPSNQTKKQILKLLNMKVQKVWSDRLPRSTTKSYVSILDKLNRKTYFDRKVYQYLNSVMEQLMNNPNNQKWLLHAGQKGGSTAFVLTMAMYATDKENNKTELALFANNLSYIENIKLKANLNEFQLAFLTDKRFRELVKASLTSIHSL